MPNDSCVFCNPEYMPTDLDYVRIQNDMIVYTNILKTLNFPVFFEKIRVSQLSLDGAKLSPLQKKEAERALDKMVGLAKACQQYVTKASIIMK